jgi:hypothetical protein
MLRQRAVTHQGWDGLAPGRDDSAYRASHFPAPLLQHHLPGLNGPWSFGVSHFSRTAQIRGFRTRQSHGRAQNKEQADEIARLLTLPLSDVGQSLHSERVRTAGPYIGASMRKCR